MQAIRKEFVGFLKEYKVVSLAIAFIMGEASSSLVSSLVKDVLLPLTAPLLAAESWKKGAIRVGPVSIAYGTFVADVLNFVIVAFLVFLVARKLLQMEKGGDKNL